MKKKLVAKTTDDGQHRFYIEENIEVLKKPLSMSKLKAIVKDGRISVNIAIDLDTILGYAIDDLNDYADERILRCGYLSDINYTVVGHYKQDDSSGGIILNVDADVSDIIEEEEEAVMNDVFNKNKRKITYGRTAYVLDCGDEMLDNIMNFLNGSSSETNQFSSTYENLQEYLTSRKNLEEDEKEVFEFLRDINNELEGDIGDIIFSV